MNCKQCNKELIHTPGRRKKEFCNNTCRSNFWYAQRREELKAFAEEGKPIITDAPIKFVPLPGIAPPPSLKGIDLAIWKSEQKEKTKPHI